jgi:hypothetical protein
MLNVYVAAKGKSDMQDRDDVFSICGSMFLVSTSLKNFAFVCHLLTSMPYTDAGDGRKCL